MKTSTIYKIQSIIHPERCYIGSAVNVKKRWNNHLSDLRKGIHRSRILQNHYNKYGETDLVFIIVEPCFPEFLIIREQHYIDTLNPYFNVCKIAGSQLGMKRSADVRKAKSILTKSLWENTEYRKNVIDSQKGNTNASGKRTEEARANMRVAHLGKPSPKKGKKYSCEKMKGNKNGRGNKGKKGQVPWNKGLKYKLKKAA